MMTPEQFCYWFKGRAELLPDQPPTLDEWKAICERVNSVSSRDYAEYWRDLNLKHSSRTERVNAFSDAWLERDSKWRDGESKKNDPPF